jgi:hypothetical protein
MQNLSNLALMWLQLDGLASKLKNRDQETQDLANAAVVMARKEYKDALSAHWSEQINRKLKEENLAREIEEMLGDIRDRKEI